MSIDILSNDKGHWLVRQSGRQLCSFVDPVTEAQKWTAHYQQSILAAQSIIVMGLGAGHHVLALREVFSGKILVIEKMGELIDHFQEQHTDNCDDSLEFCLLKDIQWPWTFSDLKRPFAVLTFAPAVFGNLEEYQNLFEKLSGRSPSHLKSQFELRGVDHFFFPENFDAQSPSESYRQLATELALPERWRKIFRILGEMIK